MLIRDGQQSGYVAKQCSNDVPRLARSSTAGVRDTRLPLLPRESHRCSSLMITTTFGCSVIRFMSLPFFLLSVVLCVTTATPNDEIRLRE